MIIDDETLYSNILLLEERGVGVYLYKDIIDEIFEYCKSEIDNQFTKYFVRGESAKSFEIPKEYIKKFEFLDCKTFKICVVPVFVEGDFECYGEFNVVGDSTLINGKLTNISIALNVSVNKKNGAFYFRTFYNTLYHELNHAYQMYNSMVNDNIYYSNDSQPSISEHIKDLKRDELKREVFNKDSTDTRAIYFELLFYYIFDKFEFNAKIAGVYGDAKSYYKSGMKFQDVLAKTEMYGIYHAFNSSIKEMILGLSDNEFKAMMHLLKKHGVKKTWGTKYSFLHRMKYWLEILIKKIARAASLCYDEMEDNYNINRTTRYIDYSMPNDFIEQIKQFKREMDI